MAQNYCLITWVNTVYTNQYLNDMKASKTSVRQTLEHYCVCTMRSITWKTQLFHLSRSQEKRSRTKQKTDTTSKQRLPHKSWWVKCDTFYLRIYQSPIHAYSKSYLLDLVLVLGLYSWDSSSMPFCLLYQSNKVRRIEGRQYSESELIELITYWENKTNKQMKCCTSFPSSFKKY